MKTMDPRTNPQTRANPEWITSPRFIRQGDELIEKKSAKQVPFEEWRDELDWVMTRMG